jgi:hypothetical protein
MHPYETIKLTERPNVADVKDEGRKSSVGKLPSRSGEFKPYTRNPRRRRAVRRSLKRADRARALKDALAE